MLDTTPFPDKKQRGTEYLDILKTLVARKELSARVVEYAMRELGVNRLVWGGHGPSRSYATELGKVLDADISKADRMKIFGGNLRRICAPIFRKKGMKLEL